MKRVLVTGGGGYLGSILTRMLLKRNYQVRIFDSFFWGYSPIEDMISKIDIVKGDIRKISQSVVRDIDAVVHLAALSNDPMADFNPKANFEINTESTKRLANLCLLQGVKRLTFASSASIYDQGIKIKPIIQNENSKVKPKAAYSLSKYLAEKALLALKSRKFCPIIFRTGTIYGFSPRMRYDLVVNTMVKNAFQKRVIDVFCNGIQWRPLVDVEDVAYAHLLAIEAPQKNVSGQIFNLVYKNYRMKDLAISVQKTLLDFGIKAKIHIDHSPRKDRSYKISSKKLKKIFNWLPKKSVETSVQFMIKRILSGTTKDFENSKYYNIEWMKEKLRDIG